MLIGYFDYAVIGILIILNIKYWKTNIEKKAGCILGGLMFGFFLPFISMIIELQMVGEWMDSFTVAYTFLRFPTYWIIGVIQIIIIGIKLSIKPNEEKDPEIIE
ncbi:hypothetical protein [Ulvibacterium sp.]|uniref:hypothetical protein n=1 Tax=Ulvibacterium sp. TaxID=2665914 RepID=UPI003BADB466